VDLNFCKKYSYTVYIWERFPESCVAYCCHYNAGLACWTQISFCSRWGKRMCKLWAYIVLSDLTHQDCQFLKRFNFFECNVGPLKWGIWCLLVLYIFSMVQIGLFSAQLYKMGTFNCTYHFNNRLRILSNFVNSWRSLLGFLSVLHRQFFFHHQNDHC
jgi:hypothetical protein